MNRKFSDIIDNYNVIIALLIANAKVKTKMQHCVLSDSYLLKIYLLLNFSMIHLASKSAFSDKSFYGISSAIFEPSRGASICSILNSELA